LKKVILMLLPIFVIAIVAIMLLTWHDSPEPNIFFYNIASHHYDLALEYFQAAQKATDENEKHELFAKSDSELKEAQKWLMKIDEYYYETGKEIPENAKWYKLLKDIEIAQEPIFPPHPLPLMEEEKTDSAHDKEKPEEPAEIKRLKGRVFDYYGKKPVAGALIVHMPFLPQIIRIPEELFFEIITVSDREGYFELEPVETKNYYIIAKGYEYGDIKITHLRANQKFIQENGEIKYRMAGSFFLYPANLNETEEELLERLETSR